MEGRRILLIISGGIAAYKGLDLIRRLRDRGASVSCAMTRAATRFITPLSVAALSGQDVHLDLFDDSADAALSHVTLSRTVDMIVVAPATADLIARMSCGLANDLASTILLANTRPVLIAPAMNPAMWSHAATRANLATLEGRGVVCVGPGSGSTACGEDGDGRLADVADILRAMEATLLETAASPGMGALKGRRALVTSGPTIEPIDPVRFVSNRSSGRQGRAIAGALARMGADVTLVSGPDGAVPVPGVRTVPVTTAVSMLEACEAALPVDVAVCAAAVADWRVANPQGQKIKKPTDGRLTNITLVLEPNPDILNVLSTPGPRRPTLVVGFAAETENVVENAKDKLNRKKCDWILANDVSENGNAGRGSPFGSADNTVHLVTPSGVEDWPTMTKDAVATALAERIADALTNQPF